MANDWNELFINEDEAVVYRPIAGGRGFLMKTVGQVRVTVEYSPAKIDLLLAMHTAMQEDQPLDPVARGWRSPQQLAAMLAYSPEEGSLRQTISRINRAFGKAASRLGLAPEAKPITTRRLLGARLNWPLRIAGAAPVRH
jgi:hypothetical protein